MDENMYIQLHNAADRLALEAARAESLRDSVLEKAECYVMNYKKVLDFLISEYKKNAPEED